MADEQLIKPRELNPALAVYSDDAIMTDDGVTVSKATPVQIVDAGAPVATYAQTIAGTNNQNRITPLRLREALDNVTAPSVVRAQAWAESPTSPDPAIPGSQSSKTWALDSESSAARSEAFADLAGSFSSDAPQSWDQFAEMLAYANGKIVQFNGVLFKRDDSYEISGLPTGPGWVPFGVLSPLHFGAVGDGATDDSPAFLAMNTYAPVSKISLLGRHYRLNAAAFDSSMGWTVIDDGILGNAYGQGPEIKSGRVTNARFVDVGSAVYSRIQYAVDFLSNHSPYDGVVVIRLVGAGFVWSHGIHIRPGVNLGWVAIRHQTGVTVTLPEGFVPVTPSSDVAMGGSCLMFVDSGTAPRWGVKVNANDRCQTGLRYDNGSYGVIESSRGVDYASGLGLYVANQSRVQATQAVFDYSNWGNRVTTNSMLNAASVKMRNSRTNSYGPSGGNSANLDVSRGSVVYVTGSSASPTELTGGQGHGLHARRSLVSATSVNCSNNQGNGVIANAGSVVAFDDSTANNNVLSGVSAGTGRISVPNVQAVGNAQYGFYTEAGGDICGRSVTVTGSGVRGAFANGGRIDCYDSNFRNGASDSTSDIVVAKGGYINASGGTGGVSQTACIQTANGMIVK